MKPSKPQVQERKLEVPLVQVDTSVPRKAFTRNLTINIGARKFLVIGGLAGADNDNHRPFVPAQRIAAKLGLERHDCLFADPRELGKIEAARAMGLKEYTVKDLPSC